MTTEQFQYVPPVECRPWCEYGDGHPEQVFREDQKCWSSGEYVTLSLEPACTEDGVDVPQQIGVMARQHPDQPGHVYVHLSEIKVRGPIPPPYNYLDHGVLLTTDEAARLARALLTATNLIGGGE